MERLATDDRVEENDNLADEGFVDDDAQYDDLEEESYDVDERDRAPRSLGWILTLGGIFGFLGAFILTIERLELLKDPNYMPTCSIDSVLQCSAVMTSNQAEAFGFPNPIIGIIAFPIVILTGVLALARVDLPAWYWRWTMVGMLYGLVFVGWLISQSLYEIRALCPYCMVVWAAMIPMFWRTLGYAASSGKFGDAVAESAVGRVLGRYWWAFMIATYVLVIGLVLQAFPYYFF
ncbi:vitamin K epoxide reductase [Epidermidibacterium keratini]|uniref:Vitamin K epoxide reductase n=1 Tax=Epidermidibacterium keratini TaxID=1891644 RepID=A0A7L4YI30_9ACTN|nr:vitamin K epoxide reductase family protein [Epidermidibacterium keratini]QHB98959.1 vitamin K epoxide reductase [Epidermidibacterium keratini]